MKGKLDVSSKTEGVVSVLCHFYSLSPLPLKGTPRY